MTGSSMGTIIWARGALEALRDVSRTIDGALCEAEAESAGGDPPLPGDAVRPTERIRGLQEAQQLVDAMVERARERIDDVSPEDGAAAVDSTDPGR